MLDMFFDTKSVAVIGAAREPGKLGYAVLDNIIKSGFSGPAIQFDTIKTRLERTVKPKNVMLKINGRIAVGAKWKWDAANGYLTFLNPVELADVGDKIQFEISF